MNSDKLREDFPTYKHQIRGMPIIYMDSACVTLKPNQVIDAISRYYKEFPACAGRSNHSYARKVTAEVHDARKIIQKFMVDFNNIQ